MGYDISFHPLDEQFVRNVIIPYIKGERELSAEIARGTQIAKNRFHANAWGLGVAHYHGKRFEEVLGNKPGVLTRLFGRKTIPELPLPPFDFNPDLYVWGRPFFITSESPSEVSEAIDRYLTANDAEAEAIAQSMVDRVAPRHTHDIRPNYDGPIPTDDDFRQSFLWKMELFRQAWSALGSGTVVHDPDGGEHDPAELFAADFPFTAIAFMAHFRPGWMDRGYVWPSRLFADAGLDVSWFQSPEALFAPLLADSPIKLSLAPTIEDNYSIGGYVPSARMADFTAYYHDHESAIVARATEEGWGEDANITARKLREAILDASSRGMGLIEASEIYSGPLGVMN